MAPATPVRVKFAVSSVETHHGSRYDRSTGGYAAVPVNNVVLLPVYDPDPASENGRFYLATPCGQITLTDVLAEVGGAFVVGAPYYVDFVLADVQPVPAPASTAGPAEARSLAAERLAGALRAMVDLWKDVQTTDLPDEVLLALARANAALKNTRGPGATADGSAATTAEPEARADALSSANDKVLAVVPNAEPAHVSAALSAFDAANWSGWDLAARKAAASSAASQAGAGDVTALAIAAALPAAMGYGPASGEPFAGPAPGA